MEILLGVTTFLYLIAVCLECLTVVLFAKTVPKPANWFRLSGQVREPRFPKRLERENMERG